MQKNQHHKALLLFVDVDEVAEANPRKKYFDGSVDYASLLFVSGQFEAQDARRLFNREKRPELENYIDKIPPLFMEYHTGCKCLLLPSDKQDAKEVLRLVADAFEKATYMEREDRKPMKLEEAEQVLEKTLPIEQDIRRYR